MPCIRFRESGKKNRWGFVCFGNEPVEIPFNGCVYRFEWTPASGWMPVNRDGSGRESPVPNGAWNALGRQYPKWSDEKERARQRESEAAEPTED